MKKMLILIGAICYCLAPDPVVGPLDDTIVMLATMVFSAMTAGPKDRDPHYVKMDRDF